MGKNPDQIQNHKTLINQYKKFMLAE